MHNDDIPRGVYKTRYKGHKTWNEQRLNFKFYYCETAVCHDMCVCVCVSVCGSNSRKNTKHYRKAFITSWKYRSFVSLHNFCIHDARSMAVWICRRAVQRNLTVYVTVTWHLMAKLDQRLLYRFWTFLNIFIEKKFHFSRKARKWGVSESHFE